MSYMVAIYGFETEEEAEKARKKCQYDFCKWAAVIDTNEQEKAHTGYYYLGKR